MAPGEGFEPPRADAQTLSCIIERKIGTLFSVYIVTQPFGSILNVNHDHYFA